MSSKNPPIAINIDDLETIPLHPVQKICLWIARISMFTLFCVCLFKSAWFNAIIAIPFIIATYYKPYRYLQWAVLMSFVWFLECSLIGLWLGQLLLIPYTAAIVLFLKPYKNYQKRLKQELFE
jgi:hypothetical protein